jgi:hypothetical protein
MPLKLTLRKTDDRKFEPLIIQKDGVETRIIFDGVSPTAMQIRIEGDTSFRVIRGSRIKSDPTEGESNA